MTPGEPSVPRQVYGSSRYCSSCEQRIRTSLATAPGLVAHVLAMLGNRLPARPSSDGSQHTAAATAAVPFNVQAMDDASAVYALLVHQGLRWAAALNRTPSAAASTAWRSDDGRVLGLRAGIGPEAARHAVGMVADWLDLYLDLILRHEDADGEADGDVASLLSDCARIVRIAQRWPTTDRPTFSGAAVCPDDGGRLLITPPSVPGGDRLITCATCSSCFTEHEHDTYARAYREVARLSRRQAERAA